MKSKFAAMIVDDAGQGLVEYALVLVLVALVAISALTYLGGKSGNSLNTSATKVP